MPESNVLTSYGVETQTSDIPSQPCVMVIFGASGDLTKRLLVPALYNLACDGLLAENFALLGFARSDWTTEAFRQQMNEDIKKFHTRQQFDQEVWDKLVSRFYYMSGEPSNPEHFQRLKTEVANLNSQHNTEGNVLFYFAVAPRFFGMLCDNLYNAGFQGGTGWKRIIVEKPFGTDLESARKLNKEVLAHWDENQIYRIDHYLGKETVQNLLSFRFSNGIFEPLWNKNYIDNIQFNVSEEVDVGSRGGYYDTSGVLRDMMQNHMFQMLACLCMETPGSFEPDSIRNEKAKLLQSIRVYTPEEVERYVVRGQYGPKLDENGNVIKPGYRQEKDVPAESKTETYTAARFHIDNWRWEGTPIYLRSGKALWKRGTEIVVEFKKAPQVLFRNTPVKQLHPNRLIFHIQPYQGIEMQFQAKIPGPTLQLQPVNMRFSYSDAFKASRYTGYEVMIYSCSHGDTTLFSRGDLVVAAWEVAQPIMDYWAATPANNFPNYARGSWGPIEASDLIEKDGRRWFEVVTDDLLKRVALFQNGDMLFLSQVIQALRPKMAEAGEMIINKGEIGREMYLLARGEVDVLDDSGNVVKVLKDGDFFGEVALLKSTPRMANVRARSSCDLFVLDKADFNRILHDHPQFAENVMKVANERYSVK
ncbi:MAG: glucose-6-phosphate dehydrogenase [Blastocatellia bacterium]|nr:glucose-6-phosphate dehydrogenase [Blastocatellia bacterium]MBL8196124.1 glucose-6-phosphate dehydrogenase [Blastocatellia bacterium]MBN8722538.1 glucose-6-phosphate dehydrogenase [Acidobacteriota bacterium]